MRTTISRHLLLNRALKALLHGHSQKRWWVDHSPPPWIPSPLKKCLAITRLTRGHWQLPSVTIQRPPSEDVVEWLRRDHLRAVVVTPDSESNKKRKWTHDWLQKREERGSYGTLFSELREEYDLYTKYMRLSLPLFEFVLSKTSLNMILLWAAVRLECTLLYLITVINFSRLQYFTRISQPSISAIVPETCNTIYDALKDDYLKVIIFFIYR